MMQSLIGDGSIPSGDGTPRGSTLNKAGMWDNIRGWSWDGDKILSLKVGKVGRRKHSLPHLCSDIYVIYILNKYDTINNYL